MANHSYYHESWKCPCKVLLAKKRNVTQVEIDKTFFKIIECYSELLILYALPVKNGAIVMAVYLARNDDEREEY